VVAGGLRLDSPTMLEGTAPPMNLYNQCASSNELTVEAWVRQ